MDLKTITHHAAEFDAASAILRDAVCIFEHELQDVQREHRKPIADALKVVIRTRRALCSAIECAPGLFTKPKSLVLHGVKCGYRKEVDAVEIPDMDASIAAAKELFKGEDSNPVLVTKESLSVAALKKLTAEQMDLLGVELVPGGDSVFCEPVEGDADKLVAALVKEAREAATRKES